MKLHFCIDCGQCLGEEKHRCGNCDGELSVTGEFENSDAEVLLLACGFATEEEWEDEAAEDEEDFTTEEDGQP